MWQWKRQWLVLEIIALELNIAEDKLLWTFLSWVILLKGFERKGDANLETFSKMKLSDFDCPKFLEKIWKIFLISNLYHDEEKLSEIHLTNGALGQTKSILRKIHNHIYFFVQKSNLANSGINLPVNRSRHRQWHKCKATLGVFCLGKKQNSIA